MNGSKSMPTDLQTMYNILKDFGITEYEHSVLNQMLEFTYRYVTTIIEDAELYSSHAKKKSIDMDDVKLAISLQHEKNFANPPSRELTAELARHRNAMSLPTIRSSAGLRLPPDRHSLTACNFHLKHGTKKPRSAHTVSRLNASNITASSVVPRPTFSVQKPPCPIIQFSEGSRGTTSTTTLSPMPTTAPVSSANSIPTQILMPTDGLLKSEIKLSNEVNSNKRVHEDDDYDN